MNTINFSLDQCGIGYALTKNEEGDIIVSGMFKIKENEDYELHQMLHSAIVMVITAPSSFFSSNPFQKIIIFSDDVKHKDGYISGLFNINLSQVIQDMEGVQFNILFSFGKYLSNIECIMKDK